MKAYAVAGAVGALAILAGFGVWKLAGPTPTGSEAAKPGRDALVIKAEEVGATWPLTVTEVTVECGPGDAIFGRYGDFSFALNDPAKRQATSLGKTIGSVDEIVKDDLSRNFYIPDARMPLDPLMTVVNQRCGKAGRSSAA